MFDFVGSPIFGLKNNSPQLIALMLRDLASAIELAGTTRPVMVAAIDPVGENIIFYSFNSLTGQIKTTSTHLPKASSPIAMDVIAESIAKATLEKLAKGENAVIAWELTNFLCDFSKI